uniref:U19-Theriditoxin-Lha1d_1 n=1 Tax=Latrodectus hasselti TaxID=256736 RepID=A0A482ZB94_LATHA
MNTMRVLWIFLTICALTSAENKDNDEDEEYLAYGINPPTKIALCKHNSEEFGAEFDACTEKVDPSMKIILSTCRMQALEITEEPKMFDMLTKACKDKSIFRAIDKCLVKSNEEFKKAKFGAEAVECFAGLEKKHELALVPGKKILLELKRRNSFFMFMF